ncbi:S-4TM family putative pore-forming effector [Aliarcobacter skirrowii]|uniref:S-4TM family putative pore-forming effector n=1 Tax=Aliarcobacter skirrowii TaxID=28200 RepID=UPI003207E083
MFKEQNTTENIKLLKAIDFYYSKAKKIKYILLSIMITIPILFMVGRYFKNIENINLFESTYLISFSLMWIIIAYFIEKTITSKVSIANSLQEKFDTNVFKIKQNKVLISSVFKSEEDISEVYEKNKRPDSEFIDWYGKELNDIKHNKKVLKAQKMNISWGSELKEKFLNFIMGLSVLFLTSQTIFMMHLDMKFNDTIVFLILPAFPLYILIYKNIETLRKQIDRNNQVNKMIEEDICDFENINFEIKSRQYQDFIYLENRANSVLIPTWFFKLFKEKMNKKIVNEKGKIK